MSLEDNGVLGIALGSSEAAGYVDLEGSITGLAERAGLRAGRLQPRRRRPTSGRATRGVGALYFSQQCVFRLAPAAGIDAARRRDQGREAQARAGGCLEAGHEGARRRSGRASASTWATRIAHYADFYDAQARADPGPRARPGAAATSSSTAPRRCSRPSSRTLAARVNIQLPDEKSRRVGQSIAAASLPALSLKQAGSVRARAACCGRVVESAQRSH
ncbi:MAG: hypothetical protein MZV63_24010 [Marinilabiliales bacterium]|nr:hypothetical protein [Marinilabiliales bacterium]